MQRGNWPIPALVVVVIAAVALTLVAFSKDHKGLRPFKIGDSTVYVAIADNEASRELGLGGRTGLAPDEGMLFIFPKEGEYPFWMKDMKFSIDILWLANDGSILYIASSVAPETYPKTFAPSSGLARYVLELSAGYSVAHNIKVGDKAQI